LIKQKVKNGQLLGKNMKVSVVIPAHNEEQYLAKTIETILNQDYKNVEIIVVDNASTDQTFQIASRFPIKVVREDRKGLLWAREKGRQTATGQIIANIDADCLPDVNWISKALPYFNNEKVVAVSGPYHYYDADRVFRMVASFCQCFIYPIVNKFLQFPFVSSGAVLIGGNNFIKAQALEKAGGYDTTLVFYGEDTNTAKRISKYGKVVFTPKVSMKTSARRFQKEGSLKIFSKYIFHFFKQIFSS
jgi:glycosyltransferase involved in cell wall biosynthesis